MPGFGRDHYRSGISRKTDQKTMRAVYVRKNGSDSNEGSSIHSPVRTIEKALELLPVKSSTGLLVDIGDGTWDEDITIPAIQFYGNSRYSRTISTRIGLDGVGSSHLGLVIRGSAGSLRYARGFSLPHDSPRFSPTLVDGEFDANANKVFHPSTVLRGTIFCTPGSSLELSCLHLRGGLLSVGGFVSGRALVLSDSPVGFSLESHADLWLDSALMDNEVPLKLKTGSSARLSSSVFVKNSVSVDSSSSVHHI